MVLNLVAKYENSLSDDSDSSQMPCICNYVDPQILNCTVVMVVGFRRMHVSNNEQYNKQL